MKDNKIIAEFMGLTEPFELPQFGTIRPDGEFKTEFNTHQLKYHTSWDWLMPVVEKIKILVMEDDSDELYNSEEWDNITHTLVQIEIKSVYQAVVEFINEYNKTK